MGAARTVQLGGDAVRHKGNTASGSNNTFGAVSLLRRMVSGLFAIALLLGVVGGAVVASLTVAASPAGATPPGYVNVAENCWATTSDGNQAANATRDFASTSTPSTVLPGGQFTLTYGDSGDNSLSATSGTYTLAGEENQVVKIDTPAQATVVSGPTITQQGYYYNPSNPSVQTPTASTVTLSSDANSPSGQIITLNMPTEIPGGDNFVTPTVSIVMKASSSPTTNTLSSGMLSVQPVGSATSSTDPGDSFVIVVTGTPVGTVNANTACWPFPTPPTPFVTTGIIDNVPPTIAIASPGNNGQEVVNSHVAANFSCFDTRRLRRRHSKLHGHERQHTDCQRSADQHDGIGQHTPSR